MNSSVQLFLITAYSTDLGVVKRRNCACARIGVNAERLNELPVSTVQH